MVCLQEMQANVHISGKSMLQTDILHHVNKILESTVLDVNVLSIAIINRSDTFVEPVDYSKSSYRKAAYRQFILWRQGHLGRGNRKVVPSSVVWSVRNRFPAPDRMYLGFKEY